MEEEERTLEAEVEYLEELLCSTSIEDPEYQVVLSALERCRAMLRNEERNALDKQRLETDIMLQEKQEKAGLKREAFIVGGNVFVGVLVVAYEHYYPMLSKCVGPLLNRVFRR